MIVSELAVTKNGRQMGIQWLVVTNNKTKKQSTMSTASIEIK